MTDSTKQPDDQPDGRSGVEAGAAVESSEAVETVDKFDVGEDQERTEGVSSPSTDDATHDPRPGGADLRGFEIPDLDETADGSEQSPGHRVTMLSDVNLNVRIELGRTRMLVEDVLSLGDGSVVELDKIAGDPVDVYVNDRLVARGEVLVLNDNFCVRISDVLSRDPHRVMT